MKGRKYVRESWRERLRRLLRSLSGVLQRCCALSSGGGMAAVGTPADNPHPALRAPTRVRYDWDNLHEQVLRETFERLTRTEAVILVGLLHSCEFRLSTDLEEKAHRAGEWTPLRLHPRTFNEAVAVVSFVFGFDGLREAFERQWATARCSELAREIRERLEAHRFVEAIVEVEML